MGNGGLGRYAVRGEKVIGADVPLGSGGALSARDLLEAFRGVAERDRDVRLALAGRRSQRGTFSVLNWIERAGLSDRISFHSYCDLCRDFPVRKVDCVLWIGQDMPAEEVSAEHLSRALESGGGARQKTGLFVTSFHPGKHEGNSALMRQWLRHLRGAGYRIHLLYYALDGAAASADPRRREAFPHDLFVEVSVGTELVGINSDGLNVHVDDWCGAELLAAAGELAARHAYDVAIANYVFMSAVFERVPSYTKRILLTHDRFSDRNRRMLAEGYPDAGWVSVDEAGEALACRRADVVSAVQEERRRISAASPAADRRCASSRRSRRASRAARIRAASG